MPGGRRFCRHDFWRILLGAGFGGGIVSLTLLARLVTGVPQLVIEVILLAVILPFAWRNRAACRFCRTAGQRWTLLDTCLVAAFGASVACAAVSFLRQTAAKPHGQWDAWAIHNLHARFLDHPDAWRDLFTPLLVWSQPDYPLLIPGFVASGWRAVGSETTVIPAAIAFLFTFGCVGFLASSIALLRDRRQGFLAALVLLIAPNFIVLGSGQLADVPLAFFLLAASALLTLEQTTAAGLAAGFAAWTKNDGVMLFAAFVIGWGLARQWTAQRLRDFGLGASVPLAALVWFKLALAPPNPLVSTAGGWQKLADPSRHATIALGFIRQLWNFGGLVPGSILVLVAYLLLMRVDSVHRGAARGVAMTLALAACGYWGVYVFTTANPLVDLIDSSLDRLLMQLWPTAVFLAFLASRPVVTDTVLAPNRAG